jgi:hypothetical protein
VREYEEEEEGFFDTKVGRPTKRAKQRGVLRHQRRVFRHRTSIRDEKEEEEEEEFIQSKSDE